MSLFTKGVFTKNLNVGIGTSSNKIHSHESIPNTPNYIQVSNNDTDGLTMGVNGLNSEINSIGDLVLKTTNEIRLDSAGNFSVGTALSTTATDGFLYVPGAPGIPSGVPTTKSGLVPIAFDTVSNKMYTGENWDDISGNTAVFPVKSGVDFVNIGLATYLNQAGEVVWDTTIEPLPITFIGVNSTSGTSTIRVVLSGKASLYIPEPVVAESEFYYTGSSNDNSTSSVNSFASRFAGNTAGTITDVQFYTSSSSIPTGSADFKVLILTNGNSASMAMTIKETSALISRATILATEVIVSSGLYQYTISGLNLSYDVGDLFSITGTSYINMRRSLAANEAGLSIEVTGVDGADFTTSAIGDVITFSDASPFWYVFMGYKISTETAETPPLVATTGDFAILDSADSNFLSSIPSNTLAPSTHTKVGVLLNSSTIYLQ
jgi:hypothetical protein